MSAHNFQQNNDINTILHHNHINHPSNQTTKENDNFNTNYLVIDSRDRNTNLYPNISDYRILIPEQYKKCSKIELVFAFLQNSLYNINKNNNKLHFTETLNYNKENIIEIEIPIGNYNNTIINQNPKQDLLAQTIETQLNNSGNSTYVVEYDSLLDNYIIESHLYDNNMNTPTTFQLLFQGAEKPYGSYSYNKVPSRNLDNTIKRDNNGNTVYEEIFIGEKVASYRDNSIAPHIGFNRLNYTGLIDGQIENHPNQLTYIIGVNTQFTKDLKNGKYIIIANTLPNQPTQLYRFQIINIISDTEMELDQAVNVNLNNAVLYKGYLQGSFIKNLNTEKYVVLSLKNANFDRLDSNNINIHNAFAILPILNNYKQPWPDEKKFALEFKNKLPDLDYLDIIFTDYYGNLIDFNGMNHVLIFSITTMNNHLVY